MMRSQSRPTADLPDAACPHPVPWACQVPLPLVPVLQQLPGDCFAFDAWYAGQTACCMVDVQHSDVQYSYPKQQLICLVCR